jgi:hypothetical protein
MSMPTFIALKKNLKQDMSALTGCKVAIMGDCATQHIAIALRGWGYEAGIRYEVLDTDYNQIDAQTMDPGSELYTFAPNYCILANCTDKLYESFCAFPPEARKQFAETMRSRMVAVWQRINANIGTRILQFNFPTWDDRVFGDFGSKTPDSFCFQLRKLNYLLAESCAEYKNVFLVDIDGLQNRLRHGHPGNGAPDTLRIDFAGRDRLCVDERLARRIAPFRLPRIRRIGEILVQSKTHRGLGARRKHYVLHGSDPQSSTITTFWNSTV